MTKAGLLTPLFVATVIIGCTGSSSPEPNTPDPVVSVDQVQTEVQNKSGPRKLPGSEASRPPRWLPGVVERPIPFDNDRKEQMATYSKRHYGESEWRLTRPKLIVQHFAVAPDVDSIFNTFASNNPDPSYGELPNVCTHFAVDDQGKPVQFVGLDTRCRHVIGLNHVSIGIEHVGYSDSDVLSKPDVLRGSLELTQRLRCAFGLEVKDVIGHNESLDSPHYEEQVKQFRGQTHSDFSKESMDLYRAELQDLGPCIR